MKREDFELLSGILERRAGLKLSRHKVYLLQSRLMPVARKFGFKDLDEVALLIRRQPDDRLLDDITEAMTSNDSLFFRDILPFEILREKVLPRLMASRPDRCIRIWSAACSSGQEPYSICMVLKEQGRKLDGWRVDVVATDLSREMLEKAKTGLYTQFEVQRGLPITLIVKYFERAGDRWRIDASIRAMVKFQEFNLLHDPRPLGRFDVVFCRNVLMHFGQATKRKVLEGIAGLLPPDGVLCLGASETVLGVTNRFHPIPGQRGLYGLADAAVGTQRVAV
ncbi:MAG: CheR family methyltransferase [Kiloniellales bacterium]